MGVLADWQVRAAGIITPFEEGKARPGVVSYGLSSYGYDARLGYRFKVFTNAHCSTVDPKAFDPASFVDVDLTPRCHSYLLTKADGSWATAKGSAVGPATTWKCSACGHTAHIINADVLHEPCPNRTPSNRLLVPPNSFALGESLETFKIPRDVLAVCLGKSTYARCGIVVNVTPLEPEWEGKVTIEVSNTTPLPAAVYAGEGIMQVLFLRNDGREEVMYRTLLAVTEDVQGKDCCTYDMIRKTPTACQVSYADKKGRYQNQSGLTTPFVQGQEDKRQDAGQRADNYKNQAFPHQDGA